MCENADLPSTLVWAFILSTIVLAMLSRKLNGHLLEIPPQPTGPFSILLRRKYHVRLRFLFDGARAWKTLNARIWNGRSLRGRRSCACVRIKRLRRAVSG